MGIPFLFVGLQSTNSVSNCVAGEFMMGDDGRKNDSATLALDHFGNPWPPASCRKVLL
jgi:hypothetical protein